LKGNKITTMGQAREIRVNGQDVSLKAATIAGLLVEQAIHMDRRGIAVALNGSVVPRSAWSETALRPGDSVEIVRAMQGG
jgi:sulfur carrier protein